MLVTTRGESCANWDDVSASNHRAQTQPCCYGSFIKWDKYWTAGDYCMRLLGMKPYDFFSALSPPTDKTICHFIQQNGIVWAMVASDWTINNRAECKEIGLWPWFKHHYCMACGDISKDEIVEIPFWVEYKGWNGWRRGKWAIGNWWLPGRRQLVSSGIWSLQHYLYSSKWPYSYTYAHTWPQCVLKGVCEVGRVECGGPG